MTVGDLLHWGSAVLLLRIRRAWCLIGIVQRCFSSELFIVLRNVARGCQDKAIDTHIEGLTATFINLLSFLTCREGRGRLKLLPSLRIRLLLLLLLMLVED